MCVCESLVSSAHVLPASQAPALLLCRSAHVLEAALKTITKPSVRLFPVFVWMSNVSLLVQTGA